MPSVTIARNLRKNSTEAEKLLWSYLRNRNFLNLKFRRQHMVSPYVADFYCQELRLIVEIDGGQHTPEKDRLRSETLGGQGYFILRYWNNEILQNLSGVLEDLGNQIKLCNPSP